MKLVSWQRFTMHIITRKRLNGFAQKHPVPGHHLNIGRSYALQDIVARLYDSPSKAGELEGVRFFLESVVGWSGAFNCVSPKNDWREHGYYTKSWINFR